MSKVHAILTDGEDEGRTFIVPSPAPEVLKVPSRESVHSWDLTRPMIAPPLDYPGDFKVHEYRLRAQANGGAIYSLKDQSPEPRLVMFSPNHRLAENWRAHAVRSGRITSQQARQALVITPDSTFRLRGIRGAVYVYADEGDPIPHWQWVYSHERHSDFWREVRWFCQLPEVKPLGSDR